MGDVAVNMYLVCLGASFSDVEWFGSNLSPCSWLIMIVGEALPSTSSFVWFLFG